MILLGADRLSRFLNAAAEAPFIWGEHDCLLWLADWIRVRDGGVDGAEGLRGSYATATAAARIMRNCGGMFTLVSNRALAAGLKPSIGRRGDIAIVSVGGDGGRIFGDEAGGILLSGSVALLSPGGLLLPRRADVFVKYAWG